MLLLPSLLNIFRVLEHKQEGSRVASWVLTSFLTFSFSIFLPLLLFTILEQSRDPRMAFWGIEVKPKKPQTLKYVDVHGKLVLTQATLGEGSASKKSILQCEVGEKSPVYLCTLLPDKTESCPLNLEFEEEEEVKFSVIGPTSIHLSGFIQGGCMDCDNDQECELYGEDIAETESDESSDYSDDESEEDFDFINDGDIDMYPPSPVRNSGVVIEEIVDDEKLATGNGKTKKPVKKTQASKSDVSGQEIVVKGTTGVTVLESEDEDGFPISSSREKEESNVQKLEENTEGNASKTSSEGGKNKNKKKKNETKDDDAQVKSLKRKIDEATADEEPQRKSGIQKDEPVNPSDAPEESLKKKKKKKNNKGDESNTETAKEANGTQDGEQAVGGGDASEEKKNKKKKKKGKEEGSEAQQGEQATTKAVEGVSATKSETKKSKSKPGNVRTFANGLVVEEVEMGKPDGKRASAGKKVTVRYIGKLQKNGKIFDSNIGKAPFKFILGIGQVIKGWDVGVEGMRVGDKRKLTIPPSMGYGTKGAGPIPPNAWLVFDVELVNVL